MKAKEFILREEPNSLIKAMQTFANQTIELKARRNVFINAEVDHNFINRLSFNTESFKFANALVAEFRQYSPSQEAPDYHPMVRLLEHFVHFRQNYGFNDKEVKLFKDLIKRGKENLRTLAASRTVPSNQLSTDVDQQSPKEVPPEPSLFEMLLSSDIDILGATFYHLLTGHKPKSDRGEDAIFDELRERGISKHASKVIIKAMQPKKEDRHASAQEFLRALLGVQKGATNAAQIPDDKITPVLIKPLHILREHKDTVYSVAFSPVNRNILASGSADGTVRLWDVKTGKLIKDFRCDKGFVNGVAFSPDGNILAFACSDEMVYLYDLSKNYKQIKKFELKDKGWVMDVAFSSDGKKLASASSNGIIQLWDTNNWAQLPITLGGDKEKIRSIVFCPKSNMLASASHDCFVRLWDVGRGVEETKTEMEHKDKVYDVAFSPDGCTLASASRDKTMRLWQVSNGQEEKSLKHPNEVRGVAFNPDGSLLASACIDSIVRLWNVKEGQVVRKLTGHTGRVWSVAFSPDGSKLASASVDNTVRIWSIE